MLRGPESGTSSRLIIRGSPRTQCCWYSSRHLSSIGIGRRVSLSTKTTWKTMHNITIRLFMAPHLCRAKSTYKDIRIRTFHHTHTHTWTIKYFYRCLYLNNLAHQNHLKCNWPAEVLEEYTTIHVYNLRRTLPYMYTAWVHYHTCIQLEEYTTIHVHSLRRTLPYMYTAWGVHYHTCIQCEEYTTIHVYSLRSTLPYMYTAWGEHYHTSIQCEEYTTIHVYSWALFLLLRSV